MGAMTLNVVLVGCGKVADQHVGEIQKLRNARMVGVCDQEPLMAEQLAFRYGISKHYSDFDRMLEETKPDVVHVTTPPRTHLHFATKALDAGCHIFVEKPLALDSKDAQYLIDYTLRKDRKMTIGYTYYFDPIARSLRKMVRDDIIGDVVHVESFFGYDLSGPFGQPVLQDVEHWVRHLPGGLVHNVIDHILSKIIEFIPDQELQIYVSAWERSGLLGLPDELRMIVRGRETSGYATFSSHSKPLTHSLTVFGSKNTVHLDFVGGCITFETSPSLPAALGRLSCAFDQAKQYLIQGASNVIRFAKSEYQYFAGLNFLMSSFYDSIIENRPVPISYAYILRVCRLMDEVFLQMRDTQSLSK
jgi:predicted dehydrogenase